MSLEIGNVGQSTVPAQSSGPGSGTWPREGSRETNEGIIISVPDDWCKSPTNPVPYTIWARQKDAGDLATTVRQTDDCSHVKASQVLQCHGDEAGTGGGVLSGTHVAMCEPKTWSESVRFENRNAVRHDDEWWMNNRNTWGRLIYTKDMNIYDTPEAERVQAKMTPIAGGGQRTQVAQLARGTANDASEYQAFWPFSSDPQACPAPTGPDESLDDWLKRNRKDKPEPDPGPKPKPGGDPPPPGVRINRCRSESICFKIPKMWNNDPAKIVEFRKQLSMQEKKLSLKSACQNARDIQSYKDKNPQEKDDYRAEGDDEKSKEQQAWDISNPSGDRSSLAALHCLDMVAGGSPTDFCGLGDTRVNSSIGSQWRHSGARDKILNYAEEMCDYECPMKVTLNIC